MPYGLKWPQDPICALGTCFSYDRIHCEKENFSHKVNQIKKLFNLWPQRDLPLYRKITITSLLGLSNLIFSCACLPTPAHINDIINKMVIEFVWSHKRPKIKKETLIGPKEKGGLDMPELHSTSKALKVAWVKRMLEGNINDWMAIPLNYLRHVGGTLIFKRDYDVNCLNIYGLPPFYHEVLVAWSQVQALNSASRNVRTTGQGSKLTGVLLPRACKI